ncbi:MAG: LPS assembly lipoprotein LptE [Akkermansia sp.]
MKILNWMRCLPIVASLFCLSSCGYHLDGVKAVPLEHMDTFSVRMFENNSLEVQAGVLVTNAITDMVQRDGTYKLASSGDCDFRIEGKISNISFQSLQVKSSNTYISTELDLVLTVHYRIVETKTNETLMSRTLTKRASFYNEETNTQMARDNAISYAARKLAEDIALSISTQ